MVYIVTVIVSRIGFLFYSIDSARLWWSSRLDVSSGMVELKMYSLGGLLVYRGGESFPDEPVNYAYNYASPHSALFFQSFRQTLKKTSKN